MTTRLLAGASLTLIASGTAYAFPVSYGPAQGTSVPPLPAPVLEQPQAGEQIAQLEPGEPPVSPGPLADIQAGAAAEGSTIVYPRSYFDQYEPVSVNDMLRRIPGISIALRGGGRGPGNFGRGPRRGLGAGENQILIDGRRIAGKESEGRDQLDRISASQVERIEIIRGTSGELDIRSTGPVINIVLVEGAATSTLSWEGNVTYHEDDEVRFGGTLSYAGQRGNLDYLGSIEVEPRYENRVRFERSVLPDMSLNDIVEESAVRNRTDIEANVNLVYAISGRDEVRLNGLWQDTSPPVDEFRQIFVPGIGDEVVLDVTEIERIDTNSNKWEIGGDYEHVFEGGSRFKFLFIVNDDTSETFRHVFTLNDDEDEELDFIQNLERNTTERIFRTSYTWSPAESHDIEIGVEGAQTVLDSFLEILVPDEDTGVPEPIDLFNADSVVEELRGEGFLVHNWQMNDEMALESSVTFELSELTQEGSDVDQARNFFFARPRVDYRWDITDSSQLRATVERAIDQLSFGDFVAAIDENDDDQQNQAGNPDLSQQKAWNYELNLEYRLPEDGGVLNARLFYNDIENIIDRVDVTQPATPENPDPELQSASGNIGDGTRYGIEFQGSLRFGFIGVPDLLVTAGLTLQDSNVTDPFLGTDRRFSFSRKHFLRLGFRHDVPDWNFNYGADFFTASGTQQIDIDEINDFTGTPALNVFVEKVAFGGITFRLDARNVLNTDRRRIRTRFDGRTSDGIPEEIEDSASGPGPRFMLSVRGTV